MRSKKCNFCTYENEFFFPSQCPVCFESFSYYLSVRLETRTMLFLMKCLSSFTHISLSDDDVQHEDENVFLKDDAHLNNSEGWNVVLRWSFAWSGVELGMD